MSKTCLKCGYQRKQTDIAPDYECPACGVVYAKYEARLSRINNEEKSPEEAKLAKQIKAKLAHIRKAKFDQKTHDANLTIASLVFEAHKADLARKNKHSSLNTLYVLLIVFGIVWIFFAYNMKTTVMIGNPIIGLEVNNIGLMDDRKAHLMISGVITLVGVILLGFNSTRPSSSSASEDVRECPYCAELVKLKATLCKHCGKELTQQKSLTNQQIEAYKQIEEKDMENMRIRSARFVLILWGIVVVIGTLVAR